MLRKEAFMNKNLVERPETLLGNTIPEGTRIVGYLNGALELLNDEAIARIPFIGKPLKKAGMFTGMVGELVTNTSAFNPDMFWATVDRNLQSITWGKGQVDDVSKGLDSWFNHIVDVLQDKKLDTYSAGFIYAGMKTLSTRMSTPSTTRLSEQMKEEYGKMYQKLVTAEQLRGGWSQIHADYTTQLRSSGINVNVVNPVIDSTHKSSGMVDFFRASITDSVIGISGKHGKYFKDENGKHIFEKEWSNFVTSDEFLNEPVETKTKLLVEARNTLPHAFTTEKNPEQAAALQNAYVETSSVIVNSEYATYRVRVIATAAGAAEKGAPENKEKMFETCKDGIREELEPLLSLLADINSGADGLLTNATTADSVEGTIAQAVQAQYQELLAAIEGSKGSLELRGMFIEIAKEKVLEALKKSRYAELKDLYRELVVDVDPQGVARMYARKFDKKSQAEIDTVAQKLVDDLSQKFLDPIYGVSEDSALSLADVFLEEAKDMVTQVNKLNPQLGAAIASAAEGILETIAKKETSEQKAKGLKILYSTIHEGFIESTSINIAQALCHETDSEEINIELAKIEKAGDLPEHVDEEYTLQIRETLENRAANTFWNEVVNKVTDPVFGANGSKTDVVQKQIDLIAQVEKELSSKSPEYQRRYIKEGLNVMLNSFSDLRDRGNHSAISALQTMIHNLVREDVIGEGENIKISPLIGGKNALLISWMDKPEELREMFAKLDHEVYGFGTPYSVYKDLKGLLVDFIDTYKTFAVEGAGQSDELQYTAFKLLENAIIDTIRTVTDTGLQKELSNLYSLTSDKLGEGAMKYLAQGKYIQEGELILQDPSFDSEIKAEMEIRFQKGFQSLEGLQGDEKDEYEKISSDIMNRELQGLWGDYWENYYDIVYGNDTAQGKPGSLVTKAQDNHRKFQEALSHEDSSYVCSFLDAAVTVGFEKFKQAKDQDIQKRIGFELFSLLGNSNSVLVKSLKARENGEMGEFGAKSVRTIGAVQVSFIRRMITDPDLMKIAFQYIETKPEDGKRKDAEELSLCMEVLMTSRDAQLRRKGIQKYTEQGLTDVVIGEAPDASVLSKIEPALLASVESATNNLEGANPELNVIFELLAALDTFSPSVLTRLGFAADDLRDMKNTRKQDSIGTKRAIAALEEAGLSPEVLFSRIYTSTGKHYFGNDFAPHFSDEIKEIIQSGVSPEGPKKNLLNRVLTYRDDVCQVVKTPPGLQLFFGEDWDPRAVSHLRSTFDKYLAGFDRRLHDKKITHAAAKKFLATELLGVSMIFESFAGQSDEAKRGPHLQFIQTLSSIIVDGMNPAGQRKYSEDIHKVAEYILRESVPYWSKEFIKDFFTVMATRAQNVNGAWIESGRWKSMCDMVVVLDESHKPLEKDGKTTRTSEGKMVREDIAEMAVDATLKVLSGYTFVGGPQNIRLVSGIVTGGRLDDMDEVPLEAAPKRDNFVIQSIAAVNWYGMPRHKKEIVRILEKLGREEALLLGQSKYMRPPQDVAELVTQSKNIAHAMGEDMKTIFTEYAHALSAVTTGVTTVFKEREDGTLDIDGLPEDSALRKIITTHERTIMSDAVRATKYAEVQKQAQDALKNLTPEKIKGMDGLTLLKVVMDAAVAGSGGESALKDLIAVFEKLIVTIGGKNGAVTMPLYNDESFSLFIHKLQADTGIASLLSTMGAQNERVGEIVEATMNSVTGLRKDLADIAERIAKATGVEDTAKTAEAVTQALLTQIVDVVKDENARQRVVGAMKLSQARRYASELAVWEAAEKELEVKRAGHIQDSSENLYEAASKELTEMKKRREQFYTSRVEIINTMNQSIGAATSDMTKIVKDATELDMKSYPKYIAWLGKTLNRDAQPEEGTVNIQDRLTTYAEYCNRHMSAQFGAMQLGASAIARLSVQPVNMAWSPKDLLRIHGLVMDGQKVRALTQEELAAEMIQEKLI